mmetsp:Transcript_8679/g.22403  ORF Transcript_8679/g.22403 Transcript_8679/m.22403 type:complete len:551 (+) Transcript_8679:68-1720(+)
MASSNSSFRNRDEYRRAMELEEARKAGIAPAAVDEDGKEINPHIPQYMSTAPWYLNTDQPTLRHQRNWNEKESTSKSWYDRGSKTFQAKKYRKGACQNCGSMTHKMKDCTERPRARGARWTNKDIAADEKVQEFNLSYDGKRDRWNGYDSKEFAKVQQRYEKIEAVKQEKAKEKELEEKFSKKSEGAENPADGGEDFLLKDEEEAGFGKVEKRVRTTAGGATGTVRNLRIREDTAKYLLNLDLQSAHYDPKSRAMRADPNPEKDDSESRFRGDAHLLKEGDVQGWERLMLYSHQGNPGADAGNSHMQALPSQAELLYQEFKAKKEKVVAKSKVNIAEKYGNAANKDTMDARLLLGQTERYTEYNQRGQLIVGEETKVVSRYEEDVLINNHKAVWGSWWEDGVWGYGCCHQTIKNSYCTGLLPSGTTEDYHGNQEHFERQKLTPNQGGNSASGNPPSGQVGKSSHPVWGEHEEVKLDQQKVKDALKVLDEKEKGKDGIDEADDKKRRYNSLSGSNNVDLTPEEMEAYKMKKVRHDDPMLKFLQSQDAEDAS